MTDWAALRAEFPALQTCAYLNTAAGAPISRAAAAAGRDYYEATVRDGDVHWDRWLARVEEVRAASARLLGAQPGEIAFVQNASAGMNHVAGMLLGRGDVLLVRDDFPSVSYPWMQAGHGVSFAEPGPAGGASTDGLAAAMTSSTRILALGLVHYRTGYRYDVGELADFCDQHDLLLVLDATQGLGAVGVDVSAAPVDFLVSSGYKWLTAGYGFGLLFAAAEHLDAATHPVAGWRSARDPYALVADRLDLSAQASALEMGHPPFAGVLALGAALELLQGIGLEAIETRVLQLTAQLAANLRDVGLQVPEADAGDHGSGIVHARHDDPKGLRDALLREGVYVSARGEGIRCSAHFYNDADDIDRLRSALDALL